MDVNILNSEQNNLKNDKKVFYTSLTRAFFLALALVGTVWIIGVLNAGSLFTGNNGTASLLGISASRGH